MKWQYIPHVHKEYVAHTSNVQVTRSSPKREEKQIAKKTSLVRMLLVFTLVASMVLVNQTNTATAAQPSKLKIYVGPSSLPADNSIYECVYVQLQDSNSRPARALQDTTISLSSSLPSVGVLDSVAVIKKDSTYAVAKFYTTYTPGTATITAAATSYATVSTTLQTVGVVPTTLAVYAFPPTIPADGNAYPAIVVQIQDSSGNPARAPIGGLTANLTCSNTTVGTIPNSITIQEGKSYAVANFQTNLVGAAGAGTAEIIAIKEDYISKTATIKTQGFASASTQLKVYVGPTKIRADNILYPGLIAVQLQDDNGKISRTDHDITVNIASSDPLVGTVPPTITILTNNNYGVANFTSTYRSGQTTITAGATDLESSTATLSSYGAIPSKLSVYCVPSALPANGETYNSIVVQLQDSSGQPARDPNGAVTVSLFSSEPTVGMVPTTLAIPYGMTYATASFTSTYKEGTTSITAQASGYTTGVTTMNTYMIDQASFGVTVTATPSIVDSGAQANVLAYVTYPDEAPTAGATVAFTSDAAGTFSTVNSLGNGYYNTTYTAPKLSSQTYANITATVSKANYATTTFTTQITILPLPTLELSVTITPSTVISAKQANVLTQVTYPGGTPATGATVTLTSSSGGTFTTVTELGNGLYNSTFNAPTFETQTVINITATAAKTNYALPNTRTTEITVLPLPSLDVAITATPSTIDAGKQANVVAHVAYLDGNPVTGATVKFTSSNGGAFTAAKDVGNGFYNTTFTAPTLNTQTTITITASASKAGYTTTNGTTQISIAPLPPMDVAVTTKTSIVICGDQVNVVAYVTYPGGAVVKGATVKFASSKGGTFSTVKDLGNGYYNTTFTAPNSETNVTVEITATASKIDYSTATGTAQITVLPVGSVPSGTLVVCIKDNTGTAISGANVTSSSQPSGMDKLAAITNGTGHVVFPNAKEGNYTINVNKEGYNNITQTINFKTNSTTVRTMFMTSQETEQTPPDLTVVWLALVAIVVACVVIAAAYLQKRRTAAKFKVPKKWEPPAPPKSRL
jgi:hypothetical protein